MRDWAQWHGPVIPATKDAKTGSEIQGLAGLQSDLNQPEELSEVMSQSVSVQECWLTMA